MNPIATAVAAHVARWHVPGMPLIVGVCGTQASGKSTACAQIAEHFGRAGLTVGTLSLDDLYLGRAARASLAASVHPLFATRGPPGTHLTALGMAVLDRFKAGQPVRLPRFDKRGDEPLPECDWSLLPGPADILLFEGWCVGARPQDEVVLREAVNALERAEDADGLWRHAVNAYLAGEVAALFARIDRLVYLRPPGFEIVRDWRWEQEQNYLASDRAEGAAAAMSEAQVKRFIAHYERLTRHIIDEMPSRADLVIQLDENRAVTGVTANPQ